MSETTTMPTAQEDAITLLPIMREYRDKLESWLMPFLVGQSRVYTQPDPRDTKLYFDSNVGNYLFDQLYATIPLVEKIASTASGLLEHAKLDFLTEREMKLRLTELEVVFRHYEKITMPLKEHLRK